MLENSQEGRLLGVRAHLSSEAVVGLKKVVYEREGYTFALWCDPLLHEFARFVLSKLVNRMNLRTRKPIERVHVGWTTYLITRDGANYDVAQPDYRDPGGEKTQTDCTESLKVFHGQLALLERLGVEGCPVTHTDKIIYEQGALEESRIYLHRTQLATHGDSGWFIGITTSRLRRKLEACYISDILHLKPAVLDALLLPEGYIAAYDDGQLDSVTDSSNRELYKKSM